MCVIAIKHKSKRLDLKTVEMMFQANPHGAGFAVVLPTETIVSKGYFDINELWNDLNTVQDETVVVHFRWLTHGELSARMTHPFTVDKDITIATQTYVETTQPVFFHNGIIDGYGNKEASDTCDFTMRVLAGLDDVREMKRLLRLINSRFVVIHDGKIHRVGDFEKYKGLRVSNTYFDRSMGYGIKLPTGKVSGHGYNWEDDDTFLSGRAHSFTEGYPSLYPGECDEDSIEEALGVVSKRLPKSE